MDTHFLFRVTNARTRENGLKLCCGSLSWILRKTSPLKVFVRYWNRLCIFSPLGPSVTGRGSN